MLLGNSNINGEQRESGSGGMNGGDGSGGEGGVQLKKGPWTAAEDAVLTEYVRKHGEGNWNAVQRNTGLARCGKSCRLRWANHLRPNLKKGAFFPEEERLIVELHAQLGNKWARMAAQLPGRTDNEIKNYWNTRVKRRLRQGLPLYPPDIQPQHQHQQHSSHSHHSYHSQPSTPTNSSSSFSFPVTPTGHHHRSHSLHHFPPPCYGLSPSPSLPPTPPPLSPVLQSPHQPPSYPTLPLFDMNNNNNNHTISNVFNISRIPPLLQNPPRLKRFHSDTCISTFAANNNNHNNNSSFNSSNNFQGSTSFSIPFSPFLRSPSSPSILSSPTSNCITSAFSTAASQLLSLPSFSALPGSLNNPNTSTMFPSPDEKDCFLTSSTGSVYNLKPELPSSQLLSPNGNAAEIGFENEKLSMSNSGSGLLEDLLEQAHAGNYGERSRRFTEDKSDFSGFNQWSDSSSMILSSELKPKEETGGQINMHEDISKLLNVIPSMQVPECYTDSGEASNCQSSAVTYDNLGLEMQQLASIFRVDSTTAPGPCSCDNLPGNC